MSDDRTARMPCHTGSPLIPHPSRRRQESIAQVGGLAGNFRPLTDSLRHIWIFYVVGYDGDRQDRLIYGPMRTIANEVKTQYVNMRSQFRNWFAKIFHFENIDSFISPRGFFVSFFVLLLLAGVAKGFYRLSLRLLRSLRGPIADAASFSPGTLFYRRLTQVLAQIDLERMPNETQGEFARRAQKVLSARGSGSDSVSDIPGDVVNAFYQIRFGHL